MKKSDLDSFVNCSLAMAYVMINVGFIIFASWELQILSGADALLIIVGIKMIFIGALYMVLTPVIRHTINLPTENYYRSSLFFGLLLFAYTSKKLLSINEVGFEQGLLLCSVLPLLFAFLIFRMPLISAEGDVIHE